MSIAVTTRGPLPLPSQGVTLRQARPEDAAAIREVVRAAYAKWVPVIGREPLPMQADYDAAVRDHRIILAETDGAVVALIETMLRPDHLWIENVAVRPDRQGFGLGRHLLAVAERDARAAGLAELRLLTNGAFAANIVLYETVGFRVTGREPFGDGVTVYMGKVLAAPG